MFLAFAIFTLLVAIGFIVYGFIEEELWPKIIGIVFLLLTALFVYLHFNTAEGERMKKTFSSNMKGGIERRVEVYDQSGKLIKTYEGKLDVQDTDYGNKVLFDLDGKRTIIYNATVIVQEK